MFGTILNLAGVLIGGIAGLSLRRSPSATNQGFLRMLLGVYTTVIGLKITITSFSGSFWQMSKHLVLLVLALTLGRLLGRLLHLQKGLNRLGQTAKEKLGEPPAGSIRRPSDGFIAMTILLCAAPLAVLGPVQDGLNQDWQPLLLKAVMDALVVWSLVLTFGWRVMLAVIPMAAMQITLTGTAQLLEPSLTMAGLTSATNGVCGLLVFCVALIIFGLKRIEVGDYLPSLAVAPLLAWLWR